MKPKNSTKRITPTQKTLSTVQETLQVKAIESESEFEKHMKDISIHTSESEKNKLDRLYQYVDHPENDDIHVTLEDKARWDAKETTKGAQAKADVVKSSLTRHQRDTISHLTQAERVFFKDKYSRAEVDNKLKTILYGQRWLKEVPSFSDLSKRYPNPQIGDTCFAKANNASYTFNGTEWVLSNTVYIALATSNIDGLLSSFDKAKLDTVEEGANNYVHPDDIDVRHVTDDQISKWDAKADNKPATIIKDGLMSKEDKNKLDSVEEGANKYVHPIKHHPSDIEETTAKQFVSKKDKDLWNAKETTDGAQEKANNAIKEAIRYTNNKIAGLLHTSSDTLELLNELSYKLKNEDVVETLMKMIAERTTTTDFEKHTLNEDVHITPEVKQLLTAVENLLKNKPNPDWNTEDSGSLSFIRNKPTSLKANGGNADTIGGFTVKQLMKNKKSSTVVIGTNQLHGEYDVDFLCDGKNDSTIIQNAIDKVKDNGKVIFREGEYVLSSTVTVTNNIILEGMGKSTIIIRNFDRNKPMIHIKNNSTVRDMCLKSESKFKEISILIEGNSNIVENVALIGGGISIKDGALNEIINNDISRCTKNAIYLNADKSTCYGNIIKDNHILNSNIGIGLLSGDKTNHSNIVSFNIIINCNTGILLSGDITKANTKNNNIGNNTVYRGSGAKSDYTDSQYTIKVDSGSKNIIHDNILSGKDALILGNNLVRDNIA